MALMKRVTELETQLDNQRYEHAMDINMLKGCDILDTLIKASVVNQFDTTFGRHWDPNKATVKIAKILGN